MRRLLPNQEFYFAIILGMGGAMNRCEIALAGGSHGLPFSVAQPIRGIESARTICGVCRDCYTCMDFGKNRSKPDCKPLSGDFCGYNIEHAPVYRAGFALYITLRLKESVWEMDYYDNAET